MTEVQRGDRVRVTIEGTVTNGSLSQVTDEFNLRLDSGKYVYIETDDRHLLGEGFSVEVIEPPKVPANAEVVRWRGQIGDDFYWKYASRVGHPSNDVWQISGTLTHVSLDQLVRHIGDWDVEVLKEV